MNSLNSGTLTCPNTYSVSNAPSLSFTNSTINPSMEVNNASLHVKGDARIDGSLIVNGDNMTKSINSRLDAIESRLAILRLDPELESRWDELKAAREHYLALEAEFKSYERVIDILKT